MTGRVVTFYSYKGGVGRSFLLANAAVWLARVGFRVLCVDWDLEAPGLYHYFQERGLLLPGPRTGLIDLLSSIQKRGRPDWTKLVRDVNVPEAKGELALLDAGDAASSDYGQALAGLSWQELYESEELALGQRLEELRAEWVGRYDLVFLDSRTGLTDSGGVCTAQLPDIVVLVFAPNVQGLEGTLGIVKKARAQRALLPLDRGGFLVLPVASRFDPNAAGDAPEKWMRILAERLQPLYDEWREKDLAPEKLATLLRVPYAPRWSFGEPLPVLEESIDDPSSVSYALTSIAAFLVRGLAESRRLVEERSSYVAEVVERNRALLGGEAHAAPSFRYDLFLSFSASDREFAREVALLLEQKKLRVFFDERSIEVGQRWVETLAKGLREARGLVSIVGPKPSSWQRAEVDAFREQVKDDVARFVLPVWRAEQPDWPELFAFQGLSGVGRSSAQVAAEIHERLLRREAPPSESDVAQPEPAPKLWSESEALDAYRAWVAKEHERLVPYFQGASEMLLEQVCVRIDLEPTLERPDDGGAESLAKETKTTPLGPRTLEELLLPPNPTTPAPRWIVMGEPGAGKTTLARSLARSRAKNGAAVPVFVPLARLTKAKLDPLAFAVDDMLGVEGLRSARGRVLLQALRERESEGELLLLLDGLDEVEPERVDALLAEIVTYASEHAAVALALLGRPIAFERRDLPKQFRRARVLALKPEQQDLLLSKLLGDKEGPRVRVHLDSHPALADLAKSPLLLTLLAVVARDTVLAESALPASRGKLYQTAIDLLLRRGFGIEKKGVKDTQPARRLLQLLSFRLHEMGGETWTRALLAEVLTLLRRTNEEANFLVKETWGTNDAFLEDVGTNAGVLGAHDGPNLPWRYLHRSLREFLVAEEVARWPREALEAHLAAWAQATKERSEKRESDAKQESGPDPERWGEVYALLCTLIPDPRVILDALGRLSSELALRTLVSVDALTPLEVLEYLVHLDGWDPVILQTLLRRWNFPTPRTLELLRSAVIPTASTEGLAHLWMALEGLGALPERKDFFERCARPLPPRDSIPFVTISGGTFLMGSPKGKGDSDEQPQHRRAIAAFQLAPTTVTRAQYRAFDARRAFVTEKDAAGSAVSSLPANGLSWYEATLYCRWLGARLPSEAEWEYACRAGTTTEYWSGDKEKDLERVGWYSNNSKGRLHQVGLKPANAFGLQDMHGNVWEWCEDTGHSDYKGAPKDGRAWVDEASVIRVLRGGSFEGPAGDARSACRGGLRPSFRWRDLGFRPARSVTPD